MDSNKPSFLDTWHNASHPIWPIARMVVIMAGLLAILCFTARDFDKTELNTIIYMFGIAGCAEGVTQYLTKSKPKEEQEQRSHPVWPFIRTLVIVGSLVLILYANASNFDETEIKTIVGMFFVASGSEGAISILKDLKK